MIFCNIFLWLILPKEILFMRLLYTSAVFVSIIADKEERMIRNKSNLVLFFYQEYRRKCKKQCMHLMKAKSVCLNREEWIKIMKELFTDDFLAAHTFVFISAGSETTATILNFVLYELAVNPDCQKRVQQEIDHVLSTSKFNYQAVQQMTYMEQFINESIRKNPLGGGLFRICTQDYNIPETNITIEKGTFLTIPIAALHKDPQYFAHPEKFDPDRFEDADIIPKGAFFNFGIGPRMCIAKRLALLEMKVYLASLLSNYNILLSKKTKLPLKPVKNAVILTIEGGIWVKFQKRQA